MSESSGVHFKLLIVVSFLWHVHRLLGFKTKIEMVIAGYASWSVETTHTLDTSVCSDWLSHSWGVSLPGVQTKVRDYDGKTLRLLKNCSRSLNVKHDPRCLTHQKRTHSKRSVNSIKSKTSFINVWVVRERGYDVMVLYLKCNLSRKTRISVEFLRVKVL